MSTKKHKKRNKSERVRGEKSKIKRSFVKEGEAIPQKQFHIRSNSTFQKFRDRDLSEEGPTCIFFFSHLNR